MNIVQFCVTRPVTTCMLFSAIILSGIYAFISLPASLLPDIGSKSITIVIRYPGQSPFTIEQIITNPVEDAISTISGIEQLVSQSTDNESRIYITFEYTSDLQFKAYEIHEKIEPVKALFPKDVNEPEIYLQGNDYAPILIVGISSHKLSINKLRDIVEHTLKKQIERIEGVAQVEIGGGAKREIHITTDNNFIISHSLLLHQLSHKIDSNNIIASTGILHDDTKDYSIRLHSTFKSLDTIKNLPVLVSSSGTVTQLHEVAQVNDYAGIPDSISRYNAKDLVSLYIYKSSIANPIDLSNAIHSILTQFSVSDTVTDILYDQAAEIKSALFNLYISCIIGILLTITVVYIFIKNFKLSIPIIIAIPFSLLSIFIYLSLCNATLNVITLSGIAIASGMVVDNSIIVIERIFSGLQKHKNNTQENIVSSTTIVIRPLFASSITTIITFIPVLLLKTKTTALYTQLASTVIIAIGASFIVSITFVPWIVHILDKFTLKITISKAIKTRAFKITSIAKKTIQSYVPTFLPYINKLSYSSLYYYFYNNRKKFSFIILSLLLLSIIPIYKLQFATFSFTDSDKFFARLEMPSGTSLQTTAQAASDIEKKLQQLSFISSISCRIQKEHADFIIQTINSPNINFISEAIQPPANSSLIFTESGGTIENEIQIIIKGRDVQIIRQLAYSLSQKLMTISSMKDIIYHFKDDRPEIAISFDRNKCTYTGIPVTYAGDYIRTLLFGPVISKYIDNGEVDIRIKGNDLTSVRDIESILIPYNNLTIPLNYIANIIPSTIITSLWHYDGMRSETMSIIPKNTSSKAEEFINKAIQQISIPEGYYIEFDKSFIQNKQSIKFVLIYVCIAVALVYMAIAAIFESLILPLIVMFSIPLAWLFSLWSLFIFNIQCNITTLMGFVVLTGTVVNNSILLIDSYLHKLKNKHTRLTVEDYYTLTHKRLQPMLITTTTTVAGLFPLIISSNSSYLWQGFAITIISGLCGSFICILIITPLLFEKYLHFVNK